MEAPWWSFAQVYQSRHWGNSYVGPLRIVSRVQSFQTSWVRSSRVELWCKGPSMTGEERFVEKETVVAPVVRGS